MADANIRAALDRHWAASNAGDDAGEGDIYCDDVELEYPQSGERFRGRRNVLESRGKNPAERHFEIRRTRGSGDLWVTEYVIFYDGRPVPTVSIITHVVPFLVEDELKRVGARYEKAADWESFAVVDGRIVTGQNPASSTAAARELLKTVTQLSA